MAEIQYFAQAALALVLFHDGFLDDQGRGDDLLKVQRRPCIREVLEHREELRIRDQPCLYSFRKAAGLLPVRKRIECVGIDQHFLRLPERAHDVLDACEVDRCFAADRAVHLGQDRSRNVVKVDPPHIACRCEAAQVSHDASSDGTDTVSAGKAEFHHLSQKFFQNSEALASFPLRYSVDMRLFALVSDCLRILRRHAFVGENEHLPVEV